MHTYSIIASSLCSTTYYKVGAGFPFIMNCNYEQKKSHSVSHSHLHHSLIYLCCRKYSNQSGCQSGCQNQRKFKRKRSRWWQSRRSKQSKQMKKKTEMSDIIWTPSLTSHHITCENVKMRKWNGVTWNGIRTLFPSHRSHLISRLMPKHTHSICTHHFLHMYIYPKHMYVCTMYIRKFEKLFSSLLILTIFVFFYFISCFFYVFYFVLLRFFLLIFFN